MLTPVTGFKYDPNNIYNRNQLGSLIPGVSNTMLFIGAVAAWFLMKKGKKLI